MKSKPDDDPLMAVLHAHGESIWRLINRVIGDGGADAEDCFQQTFVEFIKNRRALKSVCEPGGLLHRIAIARAIDIVRRRIRSRSRSADVDAERLEHNHEPWHHASERELKKALRLALARLPSEQAEAFFLTQIEQMSNTESARVMGVSANHLGVLLHRARAGLSRELNSFSPAKEGRP